MPVENIAMYDSVEGGPIPGPDHDQTTEPLKSSSVDNVSAAIENKGEVALVINSESSHELQDSKVVEQKMEADTSLEEKKPVFPHTNAMISRIRSNTAGRNYNIVAGPLSKKRQQQQQLLHGGKQKSRISGKKHVTSKPVLELFSSPNVQEEIKRYEEVMKKATSELNSVYDEIRPVIEEHGRDSQDNVSTSIAEKWMQATCARWKAEFDFHFSIVKNVICPSTHNIDEAKPSEVAGEPNT